MRYLFTTLLLFGVSIAYSQKNDSAHVAGLLIEAKQKLNIDANAAAILLDSIEEIVNSPGHNTYQKAELLKAKAIYSYRKSDYNDAVQKYTASFDTYLEGGYTLDQAKILINVSMAYNRLGDFDTTIHLATEALKLFKEVDDPKGVSISLNIIGQVYYFLENYEQALHYFRQYLQQAITSMDSLEIAGGYNNVGSAFTSLETFDSAKHYYQKALQMHLALGSNYGIGNAYQNLGGDYLNRSMSDSAIFYLEKALPYYEQVQNKSGLAEVYTNLGKAYADRGNLEKSNEYASEALIISEEIEELYLQSENLARLAYNYETLNIYTDAYAYHRAYKIIADSIYNIESREKIEEINTRYETAKKEQQIEIQNAQILQQELQLERDRYLVAGLSVLIISLIIIGILYRSRLKYKSREKLEQAKSEARETQIRAIIDSQEKERDRFARDLHDTFGQLISTLNLHIDRVKDRSVSSNEDREKVFEESSKILDDMYKELKNVCFDLMPQTLVKSGLTTAIQEFVLRVNETGKYSVSYDEFGLDERLTDVREISLYRIIQEWINNILKYSDAQNIDIQLTRDNRELTLTIEDDGMGFEKSRLVSGKGNGWKNMISRANLVAGEIELDTVPGRRGNTLILNAPLVQEKPNKYRAQGIETN